MSEALKGNFAPKKSVEVKASAQTVEEKFEAEAFKRLGGSICYVAKKKVKWNKD